MWREPGFQGEGLAWFLGVWLVLGRRKKGEGEGRTGFALAVEGGEGCEGAEENAEVGEGDGEGEPVDHFGLLLWSLCVVLVWCVWYVVSVGWVGR